MAILSYQGNEKREYQMIVVAISRGRYRILGRFLRNWAIFTVSFDEFDPNDFTPIEFPRDPVVLVSTCNVVI